VSERQIWWVSDWQFHELSEALGFLWCWAFQFCHQKFVIIIYVITSLMNHCDILPTAHDSFLYIIKTNFILWGGQCVSCSTRYNYVRFEGFAAVTLKNAVFWDVTPCGSSKNRRFGGT
jgi:hypothetical protein